MTQPIVKLLLQSPDPAIRYKTWVGVLGNDPASPEAHSKRLAINSSPAAQALLSERNADGEIPYHPYAKWYGAHWVLACLADLGYPPGDESLKPLIAQSFQWLLGPAHQKNIRLIAGRVRRCASQEGNCLWYALTLGLADDRAAELAARLMKWQWPDGGWNCDKRSEAHNSSFMETLIPLRGLARYAQVSGDPAAARAAQRAADIFLKRDLFRRQSDGGLISQDFVTLHYPAYWHYDILVALKVMMEAGYIEDERCHPALELLAAKRLPDGGFPAEKAYHRMARREVSGFSLYDWGGASIRRMNPYATVDALSVLRAVGRAD